MADYNVNVPTTYDFITVDYTKDIDIDIDVLEKNLKYYHQTINNYFLDKVGEQIIKSTEPTEPTEPTESSKLFDIIKDLNKYLNIIKSKNNQQTNFELKDKINFLMLFYNFIFLYIVCLHTYSTNIGKPDNNYSILDENLYNREDNNSIKIRYNEIISGFEKLNKIESLSNDKARLKKNISITKDIEIKITINNTILKIDTELEYNYYSILLLSQIIENLLECNQNINTTINTQSNTNAVIVGLKTPNPIEIDIVKCVVTKTAAPVGEAGQAPVVATSVEEATLEAVPPEQEQGPVVQGTQNVKPNFVFKNTVYLYFDDNDNLNSEPTFSSTFDRTDDNTLNQSLKDFLTPLIEFIKTYKGYTYIESKTESDKKIKIEKNNITINKFIEELTKFINNTLYINDVDGNNKEIPTAIISRLTTINAIINPLPPTGTMRGGNKETRNAGKRATKATKGKTAKKSGKSKKRKTVKKGRLGKSKRSKSKSKISKISKKIVLV